MNGFKIGALAGRTGTNAPTIRYYEEIRLLRSADRQAGGQRVYGDADVKRLTFIRRCREFGFSIDQVRSLVALVQDPTLSCVHARDLAQEHLLAVRAKLVELRALERSIAAFVASCDASCAGGPGPDCVILDDLSKVRPETAGLHEFNARVARLAHSGNAATGLKGNCFTDTLADRPSSASRNDPRH